MIEILDFEDADILGFRVDGKIEKADLDRVFDLLVEKAGESEKVKFYAEIGNFGIGDLSAGAFKEDIRFWFRHPGILPNINKVVLVTDSKWIGKAFDIECLLIPTLDGKRFSLAGKEKALAWLRADQRAAGRLDITAGELFETSVLKFAGGFALGLLTAGLLGRRERRAVGAAVMFGAAAAGIPLGLRVLNNNRQLLGGRAVSCRESLPGRTSAETASGAV